MGNLYQNLFLKYPNPVFIETGSYYGQGIQKAIESGFKEIYSIELSDKYYNLCKNKFKDFKHVHIIQGDSCEVLGELIKIINQKITFWLDGHWSMEDTAKGNMN